MNRGLFWLIFDQRSFAYHRKEILRLDGQIHGASHVWVDVQLGVNAGFRVRQNWLFLVDEDVRHEFRMLVVHLVDDRVGHQQITVKTPVELEIIVIFAVRIDQLLVEGGSVRINQNDRRTRFAPTSATFSQPIKQRNSRIVNTGM